MSDPATGREDKLAADRAAQGDRIIVIADGKAIRPIIAGVGVCTFVVRQNVRSVGLASRLGPTGGHSPDVNNDRKMRVTEILIRSDAGEETIAADDPRLAEGWRPAESEGDRTCFLSGDDFELPWDTVEGPAIVTIRYSNLIRNPSEKLAIEQSNHVVSLPYSIGLSDSASRSSDVVGLSRVACPGRLQWCLGMYSSGSTWVFNAVRSVAESLFPTERHLGVYAEAVDQLPNGWLDGGRITVKSHHPDEAATDLLVRHADNIWISIRDPRDCVASAFTHIFHDFDASLDAVVRSALHCERFVSDNRCGLLRYEDAFIDDALTLDRFASATCRVLTPDAREALFLQTRRSSIEKMIAGLDPAEMIPDGFAEHRVHLKTQWHTHHVNRTGEVGRWRTALEPKQIEEVQRRLRRWMQRFGYLS